MPTDFAPWVPWALGGPFIALAFALWVTERRKPTGQETGARATGGGWALAAGFAFVAAVVWVAAFLPGGG